MVKDDDGLDVVVVKHRPKVRHGVVHRPLRANELVCAAIAVGENGVHVICMLVALEGREVGAAGVRRDDHCVPVLAPVFSTMSGGAVADCEPEFSQLMTSAKCSGF